VIPPMGYRQLRLWDGGDYNHKSISEAKDNTLENELVKVRFSPNGSFGIFDKESGSEMLAGGDNGFKALVMNDTSDTWSHDIKTFADEIGTSGEWTVTCYNAGNLNL